MTWEDHQQPPPGSITSEMIQFVLQTLSEEEREAYERELNQSEALGIELAEVEAILALLAHSAEPTTAPNDLKQRILTAITPATESTDVPVPPIAAVLSQPMGLATAESSSAQSPQPVFNRRWPRLGWLGIVGVGIFIDGLGVDNLRLRGQIARRDAAIEALEASESHQLQTVALLETTAMALRDNSTQFFSLRPTPKAPPQASGSIILDVNAGVALVALKDLPPLPQDQAYHLWAFTPDGKIRCGTFNTDATGQILDKIQIPKAEFRQTVTHVRISKESILTPPDPSQKALMMTSEV
jgi:hypothetical protein